MVFQLFFPCLTSVSDSYDVTAFLDCEDNTICLRHIKWYILFNDIYFTMTDFELKIAPRQCNDIWAPVYLSELNVS